MVDGVVYPLVRGRIPPDGGLVVEQVFDTIAAMGWMTLVAESIIDQLSAEDLSDLSEERVVAGMDEAWRALQLLELEARRLGRERG